MNRLTQPEFQQGYKAVLTDFASKSLAEVSSLFIGTLPCLKAAAIADRAWLYAYALSNYNNTEGASNCITEKQMLAMVSFAAKH